MAFGRLSGKWSILQQNLKHKLSTASLILQVCAILHNFVINEDMVDVDIDSVPENEHCIKPRKNAPFGMSYLPNVPDDFTAEGE